MTLRLGIDAANLRAGGGVTHLAELLAHSDPAKHGIERVTVWSGRSTLERLPSRDWLTLSAQPELERGLIARTRWQRSQLDRLAAASCDVLFVPGGAYHGHFRPFVTMSQNMLPFQWRERARYGLSRMLLRLTLLHYFQARTFDRADGVIFLSAFALRNVRHGTQRRHAMIPHGVSDAFRFAPRPQLPLASYSHSQPFRIIYTSIVDVYKHQWNVAEAVQRLRGEGLPVVLELIGPAYEPAMRKLRRVIRGDGVRIRGEVPFAELPQTYRDADAFVFASSCENMPNILLEAMAAGLPIACANRGPMPEVLGDAGIWFDPENVDDITRALRELIASPERRATLAAGAYARASHYSWNLCADETFRFLAAAAQ
jgi:glycosyltransferase involved in cell wall biosynthesis